MALNSAARPTRADAAAGVWQDGGRWGHADPAMVCRTLGRLHRTYATALGCEHNSLLIDWKREKAHVG